jgi:hypothetical protein
MDYRCNYSHYEKYGTMKNEINIDKVLFPDSDELTISEEGVGSFQIVDAELDGINCTIDEEDVVVIDVSDYKYISLTYNNILALENFIYEMNEFYENEN